MTKSILDLPQEQLMEFYSLYNAYKAADKQDDRAKTSWKFLCFVYKHLGNELLEYFVDKIFVGDDMKRIIAGMIRARAIIQPNLA